MKLKKPSKKVVLITLVVLALGGLCWWYVANFCGPYNKSMRYLEKMAEAIEKCDTAEVERINKEYREWMAGLSKEDSLEAKRAQYDFVCENPEHAATNPTNKAEQVQEQGPVADENEEYSDEDWGAMMEAAGISAEESEQGDSITLF